MKVAILLLASLALAAAAVPQLRDEEYEFLFTSWVKEHGKEYGSDELLHRYNVWKSNLDRIRGHNADMSKTHKLAMNTFGDLTNEEFRAAYNGFRNIDNSFLRSKNYANLSRVGLPTSVDWNKAGKTTPVKDQGQCGSCWSFSSTGAIEVAYAIAKNSAPISLSEQELVDCSTSQGNSGCEGGLMDQAFQFVISNGGLCSESAYPYTASDGTCQSTCTSQVTISGYKDVTPNSEDALQSAVATTAVSVAVDASGYDWQFYSSGVMSDACGTDLDHGVLAAGYGTQGGQDYWYVKNSWGTGWGLNGYVLLSRGSGTGNPGECGITLSASYPTGATHA